MSSPDFKQVIDAFARDRRVTVGGGKGFGSGGLKVDGKLFALMSSRGQFVAKMPKQRVSELVAQGKGEPFDPGHGRLMREWIALRDGEGDWLSLAREARRFVGGGS
ncbi:MAG: hypothetical protein E6I39_09380 [Chloroflexi bacterium]|nr:MAG: hypothetical protein E6I98_10570 [Chloroflexota bacterium]TME98841.1 MAG: hypothetical protein E6I39_09380 [Chloroflexota bacterium]